MQSPPKMPFLHSSYCCILLRGGIRFRLPALPREPCVGVTVSVRTLRCTASAWFGSPLRHPASGFLYLALVCVLHIMEPRNGSSFRAPLCLCGLVLRTRTMSHSCVSLIPALEWTPPSERDGGRKNPPDSPASQ